MAMSLVAHLMVRAFLSSFALLEQVVKLENLMIYLILSNGIIGYGFLKLNNSVYFMIVKLNLLVNTIAVYFLIKEFLNQNFAEVL